MEVKQIVNIGKKPPPPRRALAEMDVKGVTAAVFHPYHSAAVVDFDASMGGILHASVADTNNSAARANSSNFQVKWKRRIKGKEKTDQPNTANDRGKVWVR